MAWNDKRSAEGKGPQQSRPQKWAIESKRDLKLCQGEGGLEKKKVGIDLTGHKNLMRSIMARCRSGRGGNRCGNGCSAHGTL
jgi:hypothetical protein